MSECVAVLPSLAGLLGADPPSSLPDRRMDVFAPNGSSSSSELAFAEWRSWGEQDVARVSARNPRYDFAPLVRDLVCVRDERFKLVRTGGRSDSLFDLEEDPREAQDVSAEHPGEVARLRAALDRELGSWPTWGGTGADLSDEHTEEIERHLADLGYL
jgi:hypothetical protein